MVEKRLGDIKSKLTVNGHSMSLDNFEDTRFKEKMLVEKVGVQTQTSSKDPYNLNQRRVVLGPNLYFKSDGTNDENPLHYWG